MTVTGVTTNLTVAAGTDNAHLNIHTGATAAGSTAAITVGNGNNVIKSDSVAGTVNVTVGTGFNLIDVSAPVAASAGTFASAITLGAHTSTATNYDWIKVGVVGVGAAAAPTVVVTGIAAGDNISIADATSVVTLTAAQLTAAAAYGTLANAIAYVDTAAVALAAHATATFVWGGNTYILDTAAGGAADAGTNQVGNTVIELVGTHTLTAGTVAGLVVVAS